MEATARSRTARLIAPKTRSSEAAPRMAVVQKVDDARVEDSEGRKNQSLMAFASCRVDEDGRSEHSDAIVSNVDPEQKQTCEQDA